MSSVSSGGSRPPISKNTESVEIDENVENVEPANCSTRLGGIMAKFGISLFVLGCLAGALIWSFNNGEAGEAHDPIHNRNASMNFTIHVSEYNTKMGSYTVTKKGADGATLKTNVFDSFWYQDDSRKRIVHRLDQAHTIYALESMSFYVTQSELNGTVQNCRFWPNLNYDSYVQRIGLSTLARHHSEIERLKNHREVYIYEGDPSSVNLIDIVAEAFLVTAYADAKSGALLGWDTYFRTYKEDDLYMTAYWYDSMSPSLAADELFEIPKKCSPAQIERDEKK